MQKFIVLALGATLTCGLGGCMTNEQTGTVLGGVIGGVAGSQVGGGRGRTAAIIAGTVIGGMIGGNIGRSMDETDRMRAQTTFENNRTNQPSSWRNPDSGHEYTVTPTRTYYDNSNSVCREYTSEATIDGRRETVRGTACREADGTWRTTN